MRTAMAIVIVANAMTSAGVRDALSNDSSADMGTILRPPGKVATGLDRAGGVPLGAMGQLDPVHVGVGGAEQLVEVPAVPGRRADARVDVRRRAVQRHRGAERPPQPLRDRL